MIRVNMLGPAEFWYQDQLLALRPLEKQMHIVLWLAGGTLSQPALAEEIWRVPSPGSANTIRSCLSKSRKQVVAIGGTTADLSRTIRLSGARTHVQLRGSWDTDVDRFRSDVEQAREAYAGHHLEKSRALSAAALDLWHDNPLPDAGDGPLAKRIREDLYDSHWSVTLTRIKTTVSLGGHREVTAELRRLLKDRPSEGTIPMLLATVLYRGDRILEAAKVCERAISAREGQGIEARRLQELQRAILNEAAALDGPLGW
ncbi:MAG TPA: bacterial transcriptional activator domain-containing protein [Streptosporangiaceae bacterium]|nr:bacterial transcriptional activator domain-containing protein [Streptosporangiaceae bacterium]